MLPDDLLDEPDADHAFGALLTTLRSHVKGKKIKQKDIVVHLPGWTISSYSRLENGELAPRFDQLLTLYRAFRQTGIPFSPDARQQFVDFARKRIALQKTHKDIRPDAEWAQLRFELARMDGLPAISAGHSSPISKPLLAETSHLVGREQWREELLGVLSESPRKKLLVVRGPSGIGKSSELNWLAAHLSRRKSPSYQVILCDLRSREHARSPEDALDVLLGSMLSELGCPLPQTFHPSFEERTLTLMEQLEHARQPVVVLVDHSECLLHERGELAPCWERFLSRFLRSQHHALLILATKQWPGWFGGEQLFITETVIPPLSREKAVLLLQQLGLEGIPVSLLHEVYEKVGGIPLCLEWVAALIKQPLHADDWEEFDMRGQDATHLPSAKTQAETDAVQRLLAELHVFGGCLADAIAPILNRIIANQCLSADARQLLQVLSVASVPLAKPALAVVSPAGPRPFDELRRASLVVAYPNRAYLLPMVASAVMRHLTPEQMKTNEHLLIQAYTAWLQEGIFYGSESGSVVAELAALLLKHCQLLEAAQLLIRYGWLGFNLGYGPHIAQLTASVMQQFDWRDTEDNECGGQLLYYLLSPFLNKTIDGKQRTTDYQRIHDLVVAGKVVLQPPIEVSITHHLMLSAMNESRFEEAQALLEACCERLAPHFPSSVDLQASLLEKRAWLLGRWSEWAEEQGDRQTAQALLDQTIAIYRQYTTLLSAGEEWVTPLKSSFLKKRLARALNSLGYHLNKAGQFEEALRSVGQSIDLKEQGHLEFGTLASSYGEKAQALAALGRFREALAFDEKALDEVQRLADAGYTLSQEEKWIYLVDRGRLYLQLGRVDEAERLFREALPNIHPRRRRYQMLAKQGLTEIEQWRRSSTSPHYQLDWRWVERYRQLVSFDAFGWLAHTGPFTQTEQEEWNRLFPQRADLAVQKRLDTMLAQARQRELAEAITEQREPKLWYPAIPIDEVRDRISSLLQLGEEVDQGEPNALVRGLYHNAIEEHVCFLRLIEAAHQKDDQRFWELNRCLHPEPTCEEMIYTLSRVRRLLLQGLMRPETVDVSQRVIQFLHERLQLSLDLESDKEEDQELQDDRPLSARRPGRTVSPETARRFFEAALQKSGYEDWQVLLDPNAHGPRVESGLRYFILPANVSLSVEQVRNYLSHELGDHIASTVAGERSPLGLLAIGTKGYMATSEGLALYHEIQEAALHGRTFDESRVWMGTLATGFARGVVTPPQSFLSLYSFLEQFVLLYRLLKRPDEDVPIAQEKARNLALVRCLRTYRGVPDLTKAGVCYTKDALYLRGLRMIEHAIAQDETLLDQLAVGKVALEQLPVLKELGITASLQPLRRLADDPDLESRIVSFESFVDQSVEQDKQGQV